MLFVIWDLLFQLLRTIKKEPLVDACTFDETVSVTYKKGKPTSWFTLYYTLSLPEVNVEKDQD